MSDPRPIAVPRKQAAQLLGMSLNSFERYAQGELGLIKRGRMVLVPVAELERWVRENTGTTTEAYQ